ncbi:MAG: gamma-glutamyltransferase family protein [Firmicutes bacterium]|nr:gamma-glutamyltransferase family protein [Bacillota bacterium]
MEFDPLSYHYLARRNVVYSKKGMVATGQPLAAQAGLEILKLGGNAIDAAVATAACLTVVEPTGTGIGGDAFCLAWIKGQLYGLNASGPAPASISIEKLQQKGYDEIPALGWVPVTVPGAPSAWAELVTRFGRLPLTKVLAPAIRYAEEGYPVAPGTAEQWAKRYQRYAKEAKGEEFQFWFDTFAPHGRAPSPGEIWRSPDHAKTLQLIAETNGEAFYRGELAEKIDAFSRSYGGYIRQEDLAAFQPEWVLPISVNYRGYDVWELPPNGQGLVALLALNILRGFEFEHKECVDTYHRQIEAIKLAFDAGFHSIADPRKKDIDISDLLTEKYAHNHRLKIGDRARSPQAKKPFLGGTVYLATADEQGNMVSYIQSNYTGFGSGLVVPGTGIALHNRGHCFSFDPDHVNSLEPGKRPYHTIIPGFLTKGDVPIGPFGIMGGLMQPQAHVQVLMNTIDFGLNPQDALDAPRWQWIKDNTIEIEQQFPRHLAQQLEQRGHKVRIGLDPAPFGRGQIIWRGQNGVYCGGTESRTDGCIAAW